jgi:damage-control phosphatase, subfamily III
MTAFQDLSLLTTISESDIAHLKSVGRDAQESRKEFVLRNDARLAWEQLKQFDKGQKVRVDFVLDNCELSISLLDRVQYRSY